MKDTWFGDKRDLVKWGTLAHLARRESLKAIVQVPYLRLEQRPQLNTAAGSFDINPDVWAFFRSVTSTEALAGKLGCEVHVFAEAFDPRRRGDYLGQVLQRLAGINRKKAVLLDPDTGMSPNTTEAEHATNAEVLACWNVLSGGDWLVVYQHFWRVPGWRDEARRRFADCCQATNVEVFSSPDFVSDVIFLAAEKRTSCPSS